MSPRQEALGWAAVSYTLCFMLAACDRFAESMVVWGVGFVAHRVADARARMGDE